MFKRRHQYLTREEFVRYFEPRQIESRVSGAVFDFLTETVIRPHIHPNESLWRDLHMDDDDLTDGIIKLFHELRNTGTLPRRVPDRPALETVEGLVLLMDYVIRHYGASSNPNTT